ncbi:MAG: zinc-dependent alcohol dehydrogenase family protein [Isosphaeraceae bacterium]
MQALVFDRFGEPGDVLQVREVPIPEPGPGQVRVRMIASPINPSDLLVVRGRYGVLPSLPSTPGFEGVGIVDKVGPGLIGKLVKGKRVAAINSAGGNWAEYAIIPAKQARPVSDEIPDEQVASFFVNPMTVLAMVRHVLAVPKGEWLLQSAAGSSLGKMIIRLCKHDGIRTINVVRRSEARAELEALGGDAVISSSEGSISEQVHAITGGSMVRYALDPVGGDTGTEVFNSLGSDSRMLVYGTLTGEPIRVDSRKMIAGRRVLEGFWLGHWMRAQSIPRSLLLFREVGRLIREGVLSTEVGPSFPLTAIHEAVDAAESVGKPGKVLLRIGQR